MNTITSSLYVRSLPAGRYTVAVSYSGSNTTEAAGPLRAGLTITKRSTKTAVSAPKKARLGKAVKGKIRVTATAAPFSGTVRIQRAVGKKKFVTVRTVKVSSTKQVSYSFKAPKSGKTMRVRALFSGDANHAKSTSSAKRVKLRR